MEKFSRIPGKKRWAPQFGRKRTEAFRTNEMQKAVVAGLSKRNSALTSQVSRMRILLALLVPGIVSIGYFKGKNDVLNEDVNYWKEETKKMDEKYRKVVDDWDTSMRITDTWIKGNVDHALNRCVDATKAAGDMFRIVRYFDPANRDNKESICWALPGIKETAKKGRAACADVTELFDPESFTDEETKSFIAGKQDEAAVWKKEGKKTLREIAAFQEKLCDTKPVPKPQAKNEEPKQGESI